jgi:hypothetical protein
MVCHSCPARIFERIPAFAGPVLTAVKAACLTINPCKDRKEDICRLNVKGFKKEIKYVYESYLGHNNSHYWFVSDCSPDAA